MLILIYQRKLTAVFKVRKPCEYCKLFSPVCPSQPLRLIVPDMVTVKPALANQFPLFSQSTSLFHIGEQSL